MARKKDASKSDAVEQPVVEQPVEKEEPIYLRDTLLEMEEIKQYGFNKYFLKAILTEKFYTLEQAHVLLSAKK